MQPLMLYGSSTLPAYRPDAHPAKAAKSAALLLYPDAIRIFHLCDWSELLHSDRDDIQATLREIEHLYGRDRVGSVLRGERPIDFTLSYDHRIFLNWAAATVRIEEFVDEYKTLLREGIVRPESFGTADDGMPMWQPLTTILTHHMGDLLNCLEDADAADLVSLFMNSPIEDYAFAARALANVMRPGTVKESFDRHAQEAQEKLGRVLELVTQQVIADAADFPIVATSGGALRIRAKISAAFCDFRQNEMNRTESSPLATDLLAAGLLSLPAPLPRSLDAIVDIRHALKDSLADFRSHLDDVARELAYTEKIEQRDIEHAVKKHLVRPVEDLARRLSRPGPLVARNLLTSSSMIGGAISFGAAVLSNASVSASALAVFGALLTAALKSRFDQQDAIVQSKVGFLFKVVEKNAG